MPYIFEFCVLAVVIGVLFVVYRLFKYERQTKRRETFIHLFTFYSTVLEYHMEKAYEIVHKDRILIYSLEATKLPDKEFNEVTQEFVRLTLKLLGPVLYKEFLELYGDENTLIFTVVEYFNSKYEDDAVRQSSMSILSEGTEQEETQ